ncbi:TetR/AcrR family transcriptional regulator [Streptomyces sp. ISL-44]|uniref:TetR/AcrR family transcriptional regulator n=1 Tax=Streptomyces sp. ISL-44 TaxID=2819184 RepID=UPI001BEB3B20|nr:TetR/AcrR family transcriptional regulator [Streptomyces sp. ISL-44]MBT2542668.1 TetR/AcrR family transcriptional regulator [Streptomyces sp. ISL-44]
MGRTREYDEDAVLSRAMHTFRRQGYTGVSIKMLEQSTGLKSGSIYHSYGDKAGLFAAAFAHYIRTVLARRIADHAPESAGLAGLRALFVSLMHEPHGTAFGCLITNSAVEFGGTDEGPPAGVATGLRMLSELFTDRLQAARSAGELRESVDPAITSLGLLALYQGLLVLVRAGWDREALETLVNDAFDDLERVDR